MDQKLQILILIFVIFDSSNLDENNEKVFENDIKKKYLLEKWSVKNQARMHLVNSDEPYSSTLDAIKYWPETATAIAIRINQAEILTFYEISI